MKPYHAAIKHVAHLLIERFEALYYGGSNDTRVSYVQYLETLSFVYSRGLMEVEADLMKIVRAKHPGF